MIRLLSFIISLFTWGAVQLVTVDYTKDIYTPIAELNNHSLSEVFENGNLIVNGDFSNDYDGWIDANILTTISTIDYVSPPKSANQTNVIQARYQDIIGNTSDVFWVKWYGMKLGEGSGASLWVFDYNSFSNANTQIIISNVWTSLSQKVSKTNGIRVMLGHFGAYIEVNNFYDDIMVLNMSELGISSLTLEQMDVYYQQYIDNKDNPPHERFDVIVNDLGIIDLIILMSFSFGYVIVFLVIRKVVKKK